MKKAIAIFTAAAMTLCLAAPVLADDTITTKRGDAEIVLTAAEDVDKTKEEVTAMAKEAAKNLDEYALNMVMDIDANISMNSEGGDFSVDMVMSMNMLDNKKGEDEYKSLKMTGTVFGVDISQEEEEYIFKNANGNLVSVKKSNSFDSDDDSNGQWIAEPAEVDTDDDDSDESIAEDVAEADSEAEAAEDAADNMTDMGDDIEEANGLDSVASDDMLEKFELLDKMYTDGTNKYYVLKGNAAEILDSGFGDIANSLGEIDAEKECYMLLHEDGSIDSLYMDLGGLAPQVDEAAQTTTTISKLLLSMTIDEPADVEVPAEVQTAGDAI